MSLLRRKTLAPDADIHQEIINAAGLIYNYLSDKGEVSISKMKKEKVVYSVDDLWDKNGNKWIGIE